MKKYLTNKYTLQSFFSLLTLLIGILLLIYMVTVENEPGAIPLLLIISGAGWFMLIRYLKQKEPIEIHN